MQRRIQRNRIKSPGNTKENGIEKRLKRHIKLVRLIKSLEKKLICVKSIIEKATIKDAKIWKKS